MKFGNRAPRMIGLTGWGAMIVLAWLGEALAQPAPGPVPPPPRPSPKDPFVQATADGLESPLVVLTQEEQRIEVSATEGKDAEHKDGKRKETHSKRQVAVRVRTKIVYPTPQLRHATATYQPIFPERTAAEQKIHLALARPVLQPWEFNESPLRDVQRAIEDQFRIPVEIDAASLDAEGKDLDTPITYNASGIKLKSALRRLLSSVDLAYIVKDDTLLMTTKDTADRHLESAFYPLPTTHACDEVIDTIESVIAADTWDIVGGPGVIRPLLAANELVVAQTQEIHEQIAELVARFDADLGPAGGNGASLAVRVYPVRDPQLLADLQAKLVPVCNAALGEAADPAARADVLGGKLVVQSASRSFHIHAAEVVRSLNGLEVVGYDTVPEQQASMQSSGFMNMGRGLGELPVGVGAGFSAGGIMFWSAGIQSQVRVYERNADSVTASPLQVLTDEDFMHQSSPSRPDQKDQAKLDVSRTERSKVQRVFRQRRHVEHPQPRLGLAARETSSLGDRLLLVSEGERRLHAMLDQPLPERWQFEESPLRDVQRTIVNQFRIPCEIDSRSLEEAGLDLDTPVTANIAEVSLGSALLRLLETLELAYVVKEETLLITTREKADEHLVVAWYRIPAGHGHDDLIDTIESLIAADTWDTVGGQGAIRPLRSTNEIMVSQALEVQQQIARLLADLEGDLDPVRRIVEGRAMGPPCRSHPIRDAKTLADLQGALAGICNRVLGEKGDPAAKVSALGGSLVVQSGSRAFHLAAAEFIRAIDGIEVTTTESAQPDGVVNQGMGIGGPMGGNPFCWVAREVYGERDPRWLAFRAWLLNEAPPWLREAYGRHGEWFAAWLRRHPAAKAVLRPLMNAAIAGGR